MTHFSSQSLIEPSTKDPKIDCIVSYRSTVMSDCLSDKSFPQMADEMRSIQNIAENSSSSCEHNGWNNPETRKLSGEIEFSMDYDFRISVFRVSIKRCRHLYIEKNESNSIHCNSYVKVILLPEKTRTGGRKTRVQKQSNDPEFHEELKFTIEKTELETRTLLVSVLHKSECFCVGNLLIGEVSVPLDFYEFKSMAPQWYLLSQQSPSVIQRGTIAYQGDLNLAIKYVTRANVNVTDLEKLSSKGELHVWIKGARNLSMPSISRECTPFAKMYMLPDRSKVTKRKTSTAKGTINPQWNVILKYENLSNYKLSDVGIEISIWNEERILKNSFLGGVRLNLGPGDPERVDIDWMDASGPEFFLWSGVLANPDVWIDGSLPLRAYMD